MSDINEHRPTIVSHYSRVEVLVTSFGYLHAWLYRMDLARDKRTAIPAVRRALGAAMRARRTCPTCRRDTGCCLPRSLGECWDCYLAAPTRIRAAHTNQTPSTDTRIGAPA